MDDTAAAAPDDSAAESISSAWQRALRSIKAQVQGVADLAALETKLAALTVVEMVALALAAALFAVTAWWLLLAAITAQLIASGLSLAASLLLIGLTNVALAIAALVRIRKLSVNLNFTATRTALGTNAPTDDNGNTSNAVGSPPAQN